MQILLAQALLLPLLFPSAALSPCAQRVSHSCPHSATPEKPAHQRQCVDCVKKHIGTINGAGGSLGFTCTLAEVGQFCSISEKGKSEEETVAC